MDEAKDVRGEALLLTSGVAAGSFVHLYSAPEMSFAVAPGRVPSLVFSRATFDMEDGCRHSARPKRGLSMRRIDSWKLRARVSKNHVSVRANGWVCRWCQPPRRNNLGEMSGQLFAGSMASRR
jgi:hypothetical protein